MKTDSLSVLDDVEQRLARIVRVDEAKTIADEAEAIRIYAKKARKGLPIQNRAALIKILAERRAGELLAAIERSKGGRGKTEAMLARVYEENKIKPRTGRHWQIRAAKIAADECRQHEIVCNRLDKELTSATLDKMAARILRAERLATRRKAAAQKAQLETGDETYGVIHGDCQTVAQSLEPNTVDLIFTDPPYHDETISLFADLGTIAARVLKPGGSLITYTPQHRLHHTIAMIEAAGLPFFWPLAEVHTGQKARMSYFGIVVHWKPLLWFVKGGSRLGDEVYRFVDDLVESRQEKDLHPWQQGLPEAEYYIDKLTHPGDLVFDPFCGGGTTAVAAAQLLRRWLTCDVDEAAVHLSRQRIHQAHEAVA